MPWLEPAYHECYTLKPDVNWEAKGILWRKLCILVYFASCQKACLSSIHLPRENHTDVLITNLFLSPKTWMKIYLWRRRKTKKKKQSLGRWLSSISHWQAVLPFRPGDHLENFLSASPWRQKVSIRVKTRHLVFDVRGEAAAALCALMAAPQQHPLGQVPLHPQEE